MTKIFAKPSLRLHLKFSLSCSQSSLSRHNYQRSHHDDASLYLSSCFPRDDASPTTLHSTSKLVAISYRHLWCDCCFLSLFTTWLLFVTFVVGLLKVPTPLCSKSKPHTFIFCILIELRGILVDLLVFPNSLVGLLRR